MYDSHCQWWLTLNETYLMFGLFALVEVLIIGSYLAIAVILLRKFLRTRNLGFVLLGFATVIWPLVHSLLQYWESKIVLRMSIRGFPEFFPFGQAGHAGIDFGSVLGLLAVFERLMGVILLLVAVWYLYRPATEQNNSTSPIALTTRSTLQHPAPTSLKASSLIFSPSAKINRPPDIALKA